MKYSFLGIIAAFSLVGCASSSVVPVSRDAFMITTSAAIACGPTGAQRVALETAAIETARQGYDGFMILGAESANNVRLVGQTPTVTTSSGSVSGSYGYGIFSASGTGTSMTTGGQPIFAGSYDQGLVVQMFKTGDPGYENSVSPQQVLGPEWQEKVVKGKPVTCL